MTAACTTQLLDCYQSGQRHFSGLKLSPEVLCHARLSGSVFRDCRFRADFRGARLQGCQFINCNLKGSDFSRADLSGASFTGCLVEDTRFEGARIDNFVFTSNIGYGTLLGQEEFLTFFMHRLPEYSPALASSRFIPDE